MAVALELQRPVPLAALVVEPLGLLGAQYTTTTVTVVVRVHRLLVVVVDKVETTQVVPVRHSREASAPMAVVPQLVLMVVVALVD